MAVGELHEEILLRAVREVGRKFDWYLSARCTQRYGHDDRMGIDIIVSTVHGPIYLQAKASRTGQARFLLKPRSIRVDVVVVPLSMSDAIARAEAVLIFNVKEMYKWNRHAK